MALITCRDTAFAYEGNEVIADLNFEINSGDYLCIVGENGSGKSTLMKGLLHLKAPSKGSITLNEGMKAAQIGYLPQQTPVQKDFPASVYEVILSGCLNRGKWRLFYTKEDKETVFNNMKLLGIEQLQHRCYRELSGGQQQRVLLARALCATQKMLLLDEPVAGLDPLVTNELYKLIAKLNQENEITVVMISHDIESAVRYASHILHLDKKQLFYGSVGEYQTSGYAYPFLGGEKG